MNIKIVFNNKINTSQTCMLVGHISRQHSYRTIQYVILFGLLLYVYDNNVLNIICYVRVHMHVLRFA